MKTTLWGFGNEVSARLVRHAYVLAISKLHVILGYPLLDLPPKQLFAQLVS